ncbi:MAG: hypothetical protein Q8P26_02330 [Candidatus Levybacteria bacterium]|nr:hypothetical protein [Candidatus Levybacteria bacterium]
MKKSSFIIVFLVGLIVVLSVAKAVVYNRVSTSGTVISKIEEDINFYKTQNTILSEKLLISSSLTTVAAKAERMGFVKDNSVLTISASKPLAVNQ